MLTPLSEEESQSLENMLGQTGLVFDSQEDANKYFFAERDKDLETLSQLNKDHPDLNLDFKARSLQRLEQFFFARIVSGNDGSFSIPEFENLMTQYLRQVFVVNEMAEWSVIENYFAEGCYDLGLMYGYGADTTENYADGLGQNRPENAGRYLYDKFMLYVPSDRAPEVQ